MIKTLKKILESYIKTTGKNKFIFILFFGVFVTFISIIEPWIFTKIIEVIENYYETRIFNSDSFINLIIYWSIFIIFTIIIRYIYKMYFVAVPTMLNYTQLVSKYSDKIINMSYNNYLGKKPGSIYKIIDRGTDSQLQFIEFFFGDFLSTFVGIFFIIIILFNINITMTLITLSMFPIMILIGIYFYYKLFPTQKILNDNWENVFGIIGNIMSNFFLSKILNLEGKFKKNIDNILYTSLKKQLILMRGWSISDIYLSTLVMISRILVLGFGTYFMINGIISFAELFLFFSYISWIYYPFGILMGKMRNIQERMTSLEKMYSEFDNLENDNDDKGLKIKKIKGNLKFDNVEFKYNKGKTIFNKLNFSINNGDKIAFVGNTGAGKSTIVNLLLRFWDIEKGKITLDGIDIKIINKQSLRNNIGVVSQDNSLFNMTIKENLLFAKPNATNKELEIAIKKAEARFVFGLEKGINTVIGERGLKLSGGEKQRLSIARLFIKDPKILILDEATSALDNNTEKLIQKALDKLMIGRTSIIIAHRLSTIQNADKIFMLDGGKIIESGTYTELMKKKEKFYNLANPEHLIIN